METKVELKNEELDKVTGGTLEGPDPSTYIYKCTLLYAGVVCKELPDDNSNTVCTIDQYTIIYVTELNCGNDYVKCMFKGEKHREYDRYIKAKYVPSPQL